MFFFRLGETYFQGKRPNQEEPLDLSIKSDNREEKQIRSELEKSKKSFHNDLSREISATLELIDSEHISLLFLLVALNTDFLDLQERAKIEELQLQVVLLLQSHLLSRHTKHGAWTKLAKLIMIPALLRQICEITQTNV